MAANYFLFVAQHNAIITIIILANRVWYVFRVSATTSSPLEYLEATDEDQRTLFPAMLGSCRGNAPARSSCFPAKLTIGCTIHYTGNSTLPIMFTTLFLVYGLPFWVTHSDPSICNVNCSYRGCRQHSLCKGLQSTNTGVFSDQVRKVTKHPVGGSLGLGCFLLILLILLTMVSR